MLKPPADARTCGFCGVVWICAVCRGVISIGLLCSLALWATACNLNAPTEESPGPLPGVGPAVTQDLSGSSAAGCALRTAWPVYTVAPGDNLTIIAQLTGSTTTELTQANCLENPDSLAVGQTLYVPRLPGSGGGSNVVAATFNCLDERWSPAGSNVVTVSPSSPIGVNCVQIEPGTNVAIAWSTPPGGTVAVTFYMRADNSAEIPIATDSDPVDGFAIQFTIPGGLPPASIYARAWQDASRSILLGQSDYLGFHVG